MYPNTSFISTMENAWNNKLDNDILPFAAERQDGAGLPVEFTEVGYLPRNRTTRSPQGTSQPIDDDEQNMAFEGLMCAFDGRKAAGEFLATHIWQWDMPGSSGSDWNMNPNGGDQPTNQQTAQWLSAFMNGTNLNPGIIVDNADFDGDGDVDGADFLAWQGGYGATGNASLAEGDANGDGNVNDLDLAIWQNQYGMVSELAPYVSQVPEPTSIVVATLAFLAVVSSRRPAIREIIMLLRNGLRSALAAVVAFGLLSRGSAAPPDSSQFEFIKGMSWGWVGQRGEYADPAAAASMKHLAETGATWVCIAFSTSMPSPHDPNFTWGDDNPHMATDAEIRHAVQLARENGSESHLEAGRQLRRWDMAGVDRVLSVRHR